MLFLNLSSMINAAPRKLYDEIPVDESSLAPVIPIKSVKEETKKTRPVSVKTGVKKSVPDFTEPVFKPKPDGFQIDETRRQLPRT